MRQARVKKAGEAYYHVTSRCALQSFLFGNTDKDMFVKMMRRAEKFSGVEVITYCVMDNHFHLLVKVPERKPISDRELESRIATLYGEAKANRIFARWEALEEAGRNEEAEEEREAFRKRMYDISEFTKTLKQRYSMWYCANHKKTDSAGKETKMEGTIWQGRFHSVLVEATSKALSAVSAYIDLNPVRAGITTKASAYAWSGYGAAKRGNKQSASARTVLDAVVYDEIITEKQNGFNAQIAGLSRSLAFGSSRFVSSTIRDFRKQGSKTTVRQLAEQGSLARFSFASRIRRLG